MRSGFWAADACSGCNEGATNSITILCAGLRLGDVSETGRTNKTAWRAKLSPPNHSARFEFLSPRTDINIPANKKPVYPFRMRSEKPEVNLVTAQPAHVFYLTRDPYYADEYVLGNA